MVLLQGNAHVDSGLPESEEILIENMSEGSNNDSLSCSKWVGSF